MTAAELLPAMRANGVVLFVTEQGALRYRGDQAVVARWLPQIKQHKPELIGLLQAANDAPARPAASIEDLERPPSAMKVYRALVAMPNGQPPRWLILLAPGCDLVEARQTLAHQFGSERVLEVIEHQAEGGAA